jgi:hypothetical protein
MFPGVGIRFSFRTMDPRLPWLIACLAHGMLHLFRRSSTASRPKTGLRKATAYWQPSSMVRRADIFAHYLPEGHLTRLSSMSQ